MYTNETWHGDDDDIEDDNDYNDNDNNDDDYADDNDDSDDDDDMGDDEEWYHDAVRPYPVQPLVQQMYVTEDTFEGPVTMWVVGLPPLAC